VDEADALVPPPELSIPLQAVEPEKGPVGSVHFDLSPVQESSTKADSSTLSLDRQSVYIPSLTIVFLPDVGIGPSKRKGGHHGTVDHADMDFVTLDPPKNHLVRETLGPLVNALRKGVARALSEHVQDDPMVVERGSSHIENLGHGRIISQPARSVTTGPQRRQQNVVPALSDLESSLASGQYGGRFHGYTPLVQFVRSEGFGTTGLVASGPCVCSPMVVVGGSGGGSLWTILRRETHCRWPTSNETSRGLASGKPLWRLSPDEASTPPLRRSPKCPE